MNQSALAKQLGLSRAAVSKWLKGSAFPRPPELLKLGKLLGLRFKVLLEAAQEYVISSFSVYKELEKFAEAEGGSFESVDPKLLHARISAFNERFETISEMLFDGEKPSADHYMRKAMEVFGTPVFRALGEREGQEEMSESVISRMFDIPLVDAKALKKALA